MAGLFGVLSLAVFFVPAAIAMTIAAARRDPAEAATHRRVTFEAEGSCMVMRRLTLRFTPEQMTKLKDLAAASGSSVSAVIRQLIDGLPEPDRRT